MFPSSLQDFGGPVPQWRDYDFMLPDINEKTFKELGENTGIMNLSEEDFSANPFPVKGVILGPNKRLMVNLVCRRKINPQKTIRVWFLVVTGSNPTFLAEKTIAALGAPGAPNNSIISPLWVAIQDKNNKICCHLSSPDKHFPEANVLGMEALLRMKVSIDLKDFEHNSFQLIKY